MKKQGERGKREEKERVMRASLHHVGRFRRKKRRELRARTALLELFLLKKKKRKRKEERKLEQRFVLLPPLLPSFLPSFLAGLLVAIMHFFLAATFGHASFFYPLTRTIHSLIPSFLHSLMPISYASSFLSLSSCFASSSFIITPVLLVH